MFPQHVQIVYYYYLKIKPRVSKLYFGTLFEPRISQGAFPQEILLWLIIKNRKIKYKPGKIVMGKMGTAGLNYSNKIKL